MSDQKIATRVTILRAGIVTVSGTFLDTPSHGVGKRNHRLPAAIVEAADNTYFFKMVGPTETINYWMESFLNFIKDIQPIGQT